MPIDVGELICMFDLKKFHFRNEKLMAYLESFAGLPRAGQLFSVKAKKKTRVSFALLFDWKHSNIRLNRYNWHPAKFSTLNTCIRFVAVRVKLWNFYTYKLCGVFPQSRKVKGKNGKKSTWICYSRIANFPSTIQTLGHSKNDWKLKSYGIYIWKVSKTAVNTTAPSSLSSS